MIYVFSMVRVRKEFFSQAIDSFCDFVSDVLEKEAACLEYSPTVGFDPESQEEYGADGTIFVMERWKSMDSFRAHLDMPYRLAFQQTIEPLLEERISTRISRRVI